MGRKKLDTLEDAVHEIPPAVSMSDPAMTREFAVSAARLLLDDRCTDVIVLDVKGLSQVSDYLVIGSGTSDRQMRSTADHLDELAGQQRCPVFRRSADQRTSWIVLDCVDVVVHIFEPNARAHYDLEMLWGDARRIDWERPEQKRRDHAGLG